MPVSQALPAGPYDTGTGTPGPDMQKVVNFLNQKGNLTDAEVAAKNIPGVQRRASEFGLADGLDPDTVLANMMSYGAQQTFKPEFLWDIPGVYTFDQRHPLYDGFAIRMGTRPHQDQARGSSPVSVEVRLRHADRQGLFHTTKSQTFGCSFIGFCLDGTGEQTLIEGVAGHVLWTSLFRDISSQATYVLGSPTTKLQHTACTFDGAWNVNNLFGNMRIGGSDSRFLFSQFLIDSPGNTFMGDNEYLLHLDANSKSSWSGLFMTCDRHSGIKGEFTAQMNTFRDSAFEGRNANTPCYGALARLSGNGIYQFINCWLAYAMTNPAATGRNDGGFIHATGGSVLIDGCVYNPANAALYSNGNPPLLYADGGRHIVKNIQTLNGVAKPTVVLTNGAVLLESDNTITVVQA